MKIGYARVSTADQNEQLQTDALEKEGCEKKRIYVDHASGAKTDRPELSKALEQLRKDDVLVVWKLDRLGRSLKHLITIVEDLQQQKVGFMSITEGFNTTTAGGKMIFNVFGALAEFERDLIRERTRAGLKAARARGRMGGRRRTIKPPTIKIMKKMAEEMPIKEVCKTLNISRASYYRLLKESASK